MQILRIRIRNSGTYTAVFPLFQPQAAAMTGSNHNWKGKKMGQVKDTIYFYSWAMDIVINSNSGVIVIPLAEAKQASGRETDGKETFIQLSDYIRCPHKIQVASGLTNGDQSAIAIDRMFVTKSQKVENHRYIKSQINVVGILYQYL